MHTNNVIKLVFCQVKYFISYVIYSHQDHQKIQCRQHLSTSGQTKSCYLKPITELNRNPDKQVNGRFGEYRTQKVSANLKKQAECGRANWGNVLSNRNCSSLQTHVTSNNSFARSNRRVGFPLKKCSTPLSSPKILLSLIVLLQSFLQYPLTVLCNEQYNDLAHFEHSYLNQIVHNYFDTPPMPSDEQDESDGSVLQRGTAQNILDELSNTIQLKYQFVGK